MNQPRESFTSAAGVNRLSRRQFLATSAAAGVGASLWLAAPSRSLATDAAPAETALPLVDLHVHLDNSTIEKVATLGRERGVKFGIVEHAGTKENQYPVVLSNDQELNRYLAMLEGQGVYRGVQTEWTDWQSGFSKGALAKLDYILTDAMTFPGRDGQRVKLWSEDVETRVDMAQRQAWMERYVQWYLDIIEKQPIDILANVSWLPKPSAECWYFSSR